MITALDHFVLLCPDIAAATADYEALLGIAPVWHADADGVAISTFAVGNTALELLAPQGEGPAAAKLRDMIDDGAGLTTLVYRSDNLSEDHHLMTRRGLSPSEVSDGDSQHGDTGAR